MGTRSQADNTLQSRYIYTPQDQESRARSSLSGIPTNLSSISSYNSKLQEWQKVNPLTDPRTVDFMSVDRIVSPDGIFTFKGGNKADMDSWEFTPAVSPVSVLTEGNAVKGGDYTSYGGKADYTYLGQQGSIQDKGMGGLMGSVQSGLNTFGGKYLEPIVKTGIATGLGMLTGGIATPFLGTTMGAAAGGASGGAASTRLNNENPTWKDYLKNMGIAAATAGAGAYGLDAVGQLGGSQITMAEALKQGATYDDLMSMGFTPSQIASVSIKAGSNTLVQSGVPSPIANGLASSLRGGISSTISGGDPSMIGRNALSSGVTGGITNATGNRLVGNLAGDITKYAMQNNQQPNALTPQPTVVNRNFLTDQDTQRRQIIQPLQYFRFGGQNG
jgi:hypothetical protein